MNLVEGYRIMFQFLENYYEKCKSDELGELLGSMSLLSDGTPADAAFIEDWETAVSQTISQHDNNIISPDKVYWAMIAFLHNWAYLGSDGTIINLCDDLEKSSPHNDDWLNAVKSVIEGKDDPYLRLIN